MTDHSIPSLPGVAKGKALTHYDHWDGAISIVNIPFIQPE